MQALPVEGPGAQLPEGEAQGGRWPLFPKELDPGQHELMPGASPALLACT